MRCTNREVANAMQPSRPRPPCDEGLAEPAGLRLGMPICLFQFPKETLPEKPGQFAEVMKARHTEGFRNDLQTFAASNGWHRTPFGRPSEIRKD